MDKELSKLLLALFLTVAKVACSWSLTCGFVYLITLCFGITCSWAFATGVWLSLVLASSFLKSSSSSKNEK